MLLNLGGIFSTFVKFCIGVAVAVTVTGVRCHVSLPTLLMAAATASEAFYSALTFTHLLNFISCLLYATCPNVVINI